MATLVVLGSGIMATALATPFTDNGNEVRLVGTHLDREIIDSIQNTGLHPHLNLEVIRKGHSPKAGIRPGDVRTNPPKFFSKQLRDQVADKSWDSFHWTVDEKWLTADDPPDIVPGGDLFSP